MIHIKHHTRVRLFYQIFIKLLSYHIINGNLFLKIEIQDLKIQKGLALQDILTELHTFINRSK